MNREVWVPKDLTEFWPFWRRRPEALLYAGGTDLLVKLRAGAVDPPALICLERLAELQRVEDRGEQIFLGAGLTHARLLAEPLVLRELPVLTRALRVLGAPPIRHMATIGGNIVTASPAGDLLPPLYVLDAEVELRREDRCRRLKVKDFILGPGRTALGEAEMLSGIWIRKGDSGAIHHFEKVGQRKALAIAVVSLAAVLRVSAAGVVAEARLAWGSVGPTIITAPEVEEALRGQPLSSELLQSLTPLVRSAVRPIGDLRATAEYRRMAAGNLLLRLNQYHQGCRSPAGDPE